MPPLDFPQNPTEGQTYAAEGALYRFTSGRWAILSQNEALTAIFGGDVAAGWAVFGDTLLQWGLDDPGSIVFQRPFGGPPNVYTTLVNSNPRIATVASRTLTGFDLHCFDETGAAVTSGSQWIAIGEALDEDKTPRFVGTPPVVVVDEVPAEPVDGVFYVVTG